MLADDDDAVALALGIELHAVDGDDRVMGRIGELRLPPVIDPRHLGFAGRLRLPVRLELVIRCHLPLRSGLVRLGLCGIRLLVDGQRSLSRSRFRHRGIQFVSGTESDEQAPGHRNQPPAVEGVRRVSCVDHDAHHVRVLTDPNALDAARPQIQLRLCDLADETREIDHEPVGVFEGEARCRRDRAVRHQLKQ